MQKSINFKGARLSRTTVKNNIIKVFNQSLKEEHFDWYSDTNDFTKTVATTHKIRMDKVAGIISALSPLKEWNKNKEIAVDLITTRKCGHTKVMVKKALDIMDNDLNSSQTMGVLNGNKISAFFMNISEPTNPNHVTVDRHAIAVALGRNATDKEQQLSDNQYKFFEDAYIWTALQLGLRPSLLQSITWVAWKRIKK